MNSFDRAQIPKITYIGRLKDSRKGIEVFLDAIELLEQTQRLPAFAVWIVGGTDQDCNWLLRSCLSRPALKGKLSAGQLQVWGRVENSCLPEIYSRSTIVVMPSLREQLGIVAVEAAFCGCPVIASRVGGLRDVVVPEFTGSLSDRGSAAALSGSLCFYLRCLDYGEWQGYNARLWARKKFRASTVYARLEEILFEDEKRKISPPDDRSKESIHSILLEEILAKAESITQSKIHVSDDLSSSPAVSASIKVDGKAAFLKIYPEKPSSFKCLFFPQPREPRTHAQAAISLLHRIQNNNDLVPKILASSRTPPFVIQEFCHPCLGTPLQSTAVAKIIESIRSLDPLSESHPAKKKVVQSLESLAVTALSQPVESICLQSFDSACQELADELFEVPTSTRRAHPQIELIRILKYTRDNANWLPADYQLRISSEIRFLLSIKPILADWPHFAHGTFKEEHILQHRKICDFDHAGYYFGPIDAAHYSWDKFRHEAAPAPRRIVDYMRSLLSNKAELYMGLCWILHLQLTRDLIAFGHGQLSDYENTIIFLSTWKETIRANHTSLCKEEAITSR